MVHDVAAPKTAAAVVVTDIEHEIDDAVVAHDLVRLTIDIMRSDGGMAVNMHRDRGQDLGHDQDQDQGQTIAPDDEQTKSNALAATGRKVAIGTDEGTKVSHATVKTRNDR
jgi:hypothetical protein